ncbi:histidine phosphatase family protein [Chelativorans sp. Marseille-P2723]|uniref:histidine phosphatase family protein n=1 Tax=Chelativorans sp. Marseille-P2723 TaxID=2709133 RepID=UPI0015705A8C|nr:histidine phosphatase family protein [Chelativorans sp. Marseille-P2723]
MTVFHLLRHASHGELGTILTGRRSQIALTAAGRLEARRLGRHIARLQVDALKTSPRLRARQTAEIIAMETGLEAGIAEELDEIDFGCWSGLPFEALSADPTWRQWNAERDIAATPAGDTMEKVALRFGDLVNRLRQEHAGLTVALVSHSDVIKAGLCHFLNWRFSSVHDFEIRPASLTTLVFGEEGCSLHLLDYSPLSAGTETAA